MEIQAAFTAINIQDHPFIFMGCFFLLLLFLAFLCIRSTVPPNVGDELTGEDLFNHGIEPNENGKD